MKNLSVLSLILLPCLAVAEGPSKQWDLGLAVTARQSPFVGGDAQLGVKPVILDSSGFAIDGPALALIKTPRAQYYVGVGLDEWDHERGDSADLSDMHELDRAINLRVGGAWKLLSGVTLFDLAQDMTAHKGTQLKARYTFNPEPYQANFRPYAELQWLSDKVTDYYVGVQADEAKLGRPAYQADAAFAFRAGLAIEQPLSPRLTLVGDAAITAYDSQISDSPIIERSQIWSGAIGLRYNW
ncbi:MipA/OmpV family protein [Thiothrix eikelboomii]|uniref:Outer membrane scaffolding protein for murein synthesis, MipA/OmpV family n=1 Tax=Thiothrix eikelboomii TaxID=92487 RepID=A0A1T4X184_9GAMM|nr:MipA/OmpV family protein [Thiothrix eikelboomii]SKA83344.1 Outer membrane scaffolding protein for murein synthesis, MipA/OmpV family [Thiothrix eikelboomii]